jgi:membrane-associated phospholipid phosphatase
MTATAVGIPLALTFPSAALAVLLMWFLIAWSRLSSGHHYPTDLILGLIIGACISLPVSVFLL